MNRLRIIHVLHSFGYGGLEKGIATLIRHGSLEFEHMVLCLAESGASSSLLPLETEIFELHKQKGTSFLFLWRLSRTLRRLKPSIVHTRNWGGIDAIIAANLAGLRRCVVQGEHGWGMEDAHGQNKKRIWARRLLSLGIREFTCVSMQMKTWIEREVNVFCPVTQIYNGIDTSRFSPEGPSTSLREKLGLSPETRLIVTIGRLDPIKDHAGLIQAFGQVRQFFSNCALILVGDGPERSRLNEVAGPGVFLIGSRSDIPSLLREADIFALASINEGISNTILEAMASGLPIVATDAGGTPELISHGKNGFLATPRNYEMLASHLLSYLRDPNLCKEHGEGNRRIVEERFSISAMVQGYEDVWRRVAAS